MEITWMKSRRGRLGEELRREGHQTTVLGLPLSCLAAGRTLGTGAPGLSPGKRCSQGCLPWRVRGTGRALPSPPRAAASSHPRGPPCESAEAAGVSAPRQVLGCRWPRKHSPALPSADLGSCSHFPHKQALV